MLVETNADRDTRGKELTTDHIGDSPEKRYVCLHRAIEQGAATDKIWEELSNVCYDLGNMNESVHCAREIIVDCERDRVEGRLSKLGISLDAGDPAQRRAGTTSSGSWSARMGTTDEPAEKEGKDYPAVPSGWKRGTSLRETHMREEVMDAGTFLLLGHIPFTLMTVMLIFPLVVGLGGTLTARSSFWVLPAIAMLPVLCIAGVVGAMSRQILVDTVQGFTDAPQLTDLPRQARRAAFFLRDCLINGLLLLMPGVLACRYLGIIGLPLLIVSAVLFPLGVALCQTREDFRGLHPKVLFPAAFTIGLPGVIVMAVVWLTFTPAMSAFWLTEGSAQFLRMSVVGPLAIVPLFISARLIGRVLYLNRDKIEDLIWSSEPKMCEDDSNIEIYDSAIIESQRVAKVSAPAPHTPKPKLRPQLERRSVASEQQQEHLRNIGQPVAPVHPETDGKWKPTTQRAPVPKPANRKPAAEVHLEDVPALAGLGDLSGFKVLVGDERVAAGASPARPNA